MKKLLLSFILATTMIDVAAAQSTITRDSSARLIESYRAYIGNDDLYNSKGERLSQPWQIIRQDRANYHAYRRRDRGDQGDSFFSLPSNRQRSWKRCSQAAISPTMPGTSSFAAMSGSKSISTDAAISANGSTSTSRIDRGG
jgi:hypothetical protein